MGRQFLVNNTLTLLCSERPKLYTILAILGAVGLTVAVSVISCLGNGIKSTYRLEAKKIFAIKNLKRAEGS